MNTNVRLIIYTGYTIGFITLIIAGFVTYRSFKTLMEKNDQIAYTNLIIHTSERFFSMIKDAETTQRSYIISNDSAYLPTYFATLDSIHKCLNSLTNLTYGNANHKKRTDSLRQIISNRIELMQYAILLKKNEKDDALPTLYHSKRSKQAMDDIQKLLQSITNEESRLLTFKTKEYAATLIRTKNIIYLTLLSYISFALITFVIIQQQFGKQSDYEKEVSKLENELTQKNEEISSNNQELISNNEELNSIYEQLDKLKNEFATIVMARTAKIKRVNNRLVAEVLKRKRVAAALRKSEERFRIALDNAPILVSNQDKDLRYTWMYNTPSNMIGKTNENIVGKTDLDVFAANDAEHLISIKRQVLEAGQGSRQEVQVTINRQKVFYLLTIEPLFDSEHRVSGITCASYDITQQKRAEEMLRHTLKELKRRNHELDNYVYKVSHDLRAPLVSILGLINLTKMENEPSSVKHYLSLIENRVNKLDDFIKSVLNHSKTLNSEIKIVRINFSSIVSNCIEELRYLPNLEKLRISVNVNEDIEFYSDEVRIAIVFKNFISNAIKFLNPFAEMSFLDFNIEVTEQRAKIVIEDNGSGIEEQYLTRIFEMFFRGTAKSDGSGLGLYIVKQTIERLEGSVTVESEVGKGTRFRILLANFRAQ
jgi:PAS domain S-box-containing protein